MSILERIRPNVCAVRLIASVQQDFKTKLGLPDYFNSVGLLTADSDDVTYIAADEATKHAQVEVISGRSLYAGASHGPSPTAGEVLIIFGGPTPAEVRSGLDAAIATINNGPAFQWADEAHSVAFLAHLVSRTGSYLSKVAGTEQGGSLAYLIAPPLEAAYGIDAALKAANVELATYIPAPSETNYSGAFLSGDQAACSAACAAFREAVLGIARAPLAW
ncbi:MAG: ethanolamine utilization microcompartment protein EutL [Betaproteobacteria bacterium]